MGETTKLANLIDPEVIGQKIDKKLIYMIRFAPLAEVDDTLVGVPGSTLSLPAFAYIGAADDGVEGSAISTVSLNASMVSVQIKEAVKGVEITDKAILAGFGDPVGEAVKQLRLSVADKVDIDFLTTMRTIGSEMTYSTGASTSAITPGGITDALELFGEDVDGVKALLCSPRLYKEIRKAEDWLPASEIAADLLIRGAVGETNGCQIIVSNRLRGAKANEGKDEDAFIIKPGALRLILKRDTLVENDRDILRRVNVLTANKHYVTYLYDASKAIRLKVPTA